MISQLFSALMVFFIGWILIAADPGERIHRLCKPVEWTGNLVVSMVSLTYPQGQLRVKSSIESTQYACEFSVWRLFYEEDFVRELEESSNEGDLGENL